LKITDFYKKLIFKDKSSKLSPERVEIRLQSRKTSIGIFSN